jgi:hypothetical protein
MFQRLHRVNTAKKLQGGEHMPGRKYIWILTLTTLVCSAVVASRAQTTLGAFQLGQGWATFGFSAPPGAIPSGASVALQNLQTQMDVKTRWSDGSVRFGVVTAKVSSASTYNMGVVSSPAPGSFTPTWPTARVRFTIGGAGYTASLPGAMPSNNWLNGPLVRESRAIVLPTRDSDGSQHPLLQVIFDVRAYSDGQSRVDVCVQNVRDVAAMDLVTYDVNVDINGKTVYTKSALPHYSFTRWRKVFPAGLVASSIVPDFSPYQSANALPRYLSSVYNQTYDVSGPDFDINGFGNMNPSQPDPGGRPEIAPFPTWVAQYVVHRQASQRQAVLLNGDLSGSWSNFITQDDGVSLIRLDQYPDYWLDPRGEPWPGRPRAPYATDPSTGMTTFRGTRDGVGPRYPRVDAEHVPSVAYVPYILTGDRFYLDQLKLWANNMVLRFWNPSGLVKDGIPVSREGAKGIMANEWGGASGGRGWAWPLREVINAAVACPDSDPDKAYFAYIVRSNLDWATTYNSISNKTGVTEATGWEGDTQHGDRLLVSLWQSAYLAWSMDWAERQGFDLGGAKEFRNRMIRSQINFLTHGASGYDPNYGVPYYVQVGRRVNNVPQLFTTWQEVWNANQANVDWLPSNNRLPPIIIGYYGLEARLLLIMGSREKLAGADTALNWLLAYRDSTGTSVIDDANNSRPGFAIYFGNDPTSPFDTPPAPATPTNVRIIR